MEVNWVIAAFTIVIAGTTVSYTLVTWRLLRLSRWSLLLDTLIRITQEIEKREQRHVKELMAESSDMVNKLGIEKIKRRWELSRTKWETEPYRKGLTEAIVGVNKKLGLDLVKGLIDYVKKAGEVRKDVKNEFVGFREELKDLLKKGVKKGGQKKR